MKLINRDECLTKLKDTLYISYKEPFSNHLSISKEEIPNILIYTKTLEKLIVHK